MGSLDHWFADYIQPATAKAAISAIACAENSNNSRNSNSSPRDFHFHTPVATTQKALPSAWTDALVRLRDMPRSPLITPQRWQCVLANVAKLSDTHIKDLIHHGWARAEIFGCHPTAPEARYDSMGLLLLMDEAEMIAEIDPRRIKLQHSATGNCLYFMKRVTTTERIMLWELR